MTHNKYSPALVCGFGIAVITTIPGLKNFTCCLLVPAGSILALFINQKLNRFSSAISSNQALMFGLLTGIFSALFITFFDVFLTYIFKTNELVEALPQTQLIISNFNLGEAGKQAMKLLKNITDEITTSGFSILFTIFILINNLVINSIFGIIGGFIGMSLLNKKYHNNPTNFVE